MFDESPDLRQRKILNIMIGELQSEKASKPFLLSTVALETVGSDTIYREVNSKLQKILKRSSDALNFKLLLTDKASYCLKAGEKLKNMYPNMKNVTCICHGLHNFAETVREKCPTINKFIAIF